MDIAHMSKAWYMRMFRKYIGTTPYNHILSLRITKAKEYLEVTDMTVHEIATATGFSDDPSFSTLFRNDGNESAEVPERGNYTETASAVTAFSSAGFPSGTGIE